MMDRVDDMQDTLTAQIQQSSPLALTPKAAAHTLQLEAAPCPQAQVGPLDSAGTTTAVSESDQQETMLALLHRASTAGSCVPVAKRTSSHTKTRQELVPAEFLGIAHLDPPHTEFAFDVRNVPDPPAIKFSNDIDRLFCEWEILTLLVVNGHGIPIKHWGQFYKKAAGAKGTAWDALKTKWSKWKVSWAQSFDLFLFFMPTDSLLLKNVANTLTTPPSGTSSARRRANDSATSRF